MTARIARAAGLDERASRQPPKQSDFCSRGWLRGSEEGSGCKRERSNQTRRITCGSRSEERHGASRKVRS
jgi:hypothetical protein